MNNHWVSNCHPLDVLLWTDYFLNHGFQTGHEDIRMTSIIHPLDVLWMSIVRPWYMLFKGRPSDFHLDKIWTVLDIHWICHGQILLSGLIFQKSTRTRVTPKPSEISPGKTGWRFVRLHEIQELF